MRRRGLIIALAGLLASACGGSSSTLHHLGAPKGSGPIDFQIENRSDRIVNNLFLAKTTAVRAAGPQAFESGSDAQQRLWGEDQLVGSALEIAGKVRVPITEPGRYDVRAVARDGLEQHVAGLDLKAGGRYVLELHDGSWRRPR